MYLLLIIWDWDQIKIQFWSIKWRWSQTDEGLNCPVFVFLRLEIVSKDPGPPFLVSNLRTKGDDVTNIWRHSIPGVIPVPGHWHLQKDIAMRGSHWSDCHNTALWLATWQMESDQHPQLLVSVSRVSRLWQIINKHRDSQCQNILLLT